MVGHFRIVGRVIGQSRHSKTLSRRIPAHRDRLRDRVGPTARREGELCRRDAHPIVVFFPSDGRVLAVIDASGRLRGHGAARNRVIRRGRHRSALRTQGVRGGAQMHGRRVRRARRRGIPCVHLRGKRPRLHRHVFAVAAVASVVGHQVIRDLIGAPERHVGPELRLPRPFLVGHRARARLRHVLNHIVLDIGAVCRLHIAAVGALLHAAYVGVDFGIGRRGKRAVQLTCRDVVEGGRIWIARPLRIRPHPFVVFVNIAASICCLPVHNEVVDVSIEHGQLDIVTVVVGAPLVHGHVVARLDGPHDGKAYGTRGRLPARETRDVAPLHARGTGRALVRRVHRDGASLRTCRPFRIRIACICGDLHL